MLFERIMDLLFLFQWKTKTEGTTKMFKKKEKHRNCKFEIHVIILNFKFNKNCYKKCFALRIIEFLPSEIIPTALAIALAVIG